jgi:hypothetical protein
VQRRAKWTIAIACVVVVAGASVGIDLAAEPNHQAPTALKTAPVASKIATAVATATTDSPAWAYTTDYGFVLMRGNKVVAKVSENEPVFANGGQIVWTQDGDYVAYFGQVPPGEVGTSENAVQSLTSINTHTGAVQSSPCPGCENLVAMTGNTVDAMAGGTSGIHLLSFDLDLPKPTGVATAPGFSTTRDDQLVAGLDGYILVDDFGATESSSGVLTQTPEDLYMVNAAGATTDDYGNMGQAQIAPVVAALKTVYGSPVIAYQLAVGSGTDATQEVSLIDPVSGMLSQTNMSAVAQQGSYFVSDLSWSAEGSLNAEIDICTNPCTDPDSQDWPATLWQLNTKLQWIDEGATSFAEVRQLDRTTKLELISVGQSSDYTLYSVESDKRTEVAISVIGISTPEG